jgi:hypothetical protein
VDRRHLLGAGAGLLASAGCFVAGGGVVYGILVVAGTGRLLGWPPLLFDRALRTDFGPNLTPVGYVVYLVAWVLPFVLGGAVVGDLLGPREPRGGP